MDGLESKKVVNRRKVQYEGMYNGCTVVFKPGEAKHFPPNIAYALVKDSALKMDLASGLVNEYALGIEEDKAFPTAALKGDLAKKNDVELVDRKNEPQLTETEPKILGADGFEDLGIGKAEKTVTPLPQENIFEYATANQVKPMGFRNPDVKTGPQNSSSFTDENGGSRVVSKSQ